MFNLIIFVWTTSFFDFWSRVKSGGQRVLSLSQYEFTSLSELMGFMEWDLLQELPISNHKTLAPWAREGKWGRRVWNLKENRLHSEWFKGWGFIVPGVPALDDVSAKAGTCWPGKETIIEAIWSCGKEGWQDRLVRAHGCRAYLGFSHLPRWHTLKRDCGKGDPSSKRHVLVSKLLSHSRSSKSGNCAVGCPWLPAGCTHAHGEVNWEKHFLFLAIDFMCFTNVNAWHQLSLNLGMKELEILGLGWLSD